MIWHIILYVGIGLLILGVALIFIYMCIDARTGLASNRVGVVGFRLGLIGLILTVICLPIVLSSDYDSKQQYNYFVAQKQIIENHVSDNTMDEALNKKRNDLNDWLIDEQFKYKSYRALSFYDESIMNLELIQ